MEFSRNSVNLFGVSIHYYGILIALGVLLGVILAMKREKQFGLPKDSALDVALVSVPAAIIGARLYYVIFEWDSFRGDLMSILDIRSGGLAIYGGLIGAFLAGTIFCKVKKRSVLRMMDLAAPSIALGQAIGRWGNFFNQEAYGVEIIDPALQFFPIGVFIDGAQRWHYATFFYESMWCLGLCAFLLYAGRKRFFRRDGDVILWYALLYGLERSLVEGLRTDSLYLGPLRISQALSLVLIFAAAVIFARHSGKLRPMRLAAPAVSAVSVILSLFGLIYPALILAVIAAAFAAVAYAYSA